MAVAMSEISKKSLGHSLVQQATKEAWTTYVRARWPENTQAHCEREWDLTPGRANGLVWGHITQSTIDHIREHKRGGLRVVLAVEATCFGLSVGDMLERYFREEREAIAHERRQWDEREQRVLALEALARQRRRHARDDGRSDAHPSGRHWVETPRVGGDLIYDDGD